MNGRAATLENTRHCGHPCGGSSAATQGLDRPMVELCAHEARVLKERARGLKAYNAEVQGKADPHMLKLRAEQKSPVQLLGPWRNGKTKSHHNHRATDNVERSYRAPQLRQRLGACDAPCPLPLDRTSGHASRKRTDAWTANQLPPTKTKKAQRMWKLILGSHGLACASIVVQQMALST